MTRQVVSLSHAHMFSCIDSWYDNEVGYSKRMAELCHIAAAKNISKTEPTFKYE